MELFPEWVLNDIQSPGPQKTAVKNAKLCKTRSR